MIIKENDFKIVKDDSNYVLYVLKSKKEIKENSESTYKIFGYYYTIIGALKGALSYRKDKKYTGKESVSDLKLLIDKFIDDKEIMDDMVSSIHEPINDLFNKLISKTFK
jgi:hypothetical protein